MRIPREFDGGRPAGELSQERKISEQTLNRWKREHAVMEVRDAPRLKELEDENRRLKRLLAEKHLRIDVLEKVLKKNREPGEQERSHQAHSGNRDVLRSSRLQMARPEPQPVRAYTRAVRPNRTDPAANLKSCLDQSHVDTIYIGPGTPGKPLAPRTSTAGSATTASTPNGFRAWQRASLPERAPRILRQRAAAPRHRVRLSGANLQSRKLRLDRGYAGPSSKPCHCPTTANIQPNLSRLAF